MTKVSSITKISNVDNFWDWLDTLGYHIPEERRLVIWRKARSCKSVVWVAGSKEDDFHFY